ncbi:MAG: hypothetical protein LDL41_10755 [Coleofasciculus sp. S288]|nr:hypothetical protein [Coleofasciculus sp. S288]
MIALLTSRSPNTTAWRKYDSPIIKLTLKAIALPMETLTLNVPPAVGLTDEQFYQLCVANQEWRLELTA